MIRISDLDYLENSNEVAFLASLNGASGANVSVSTFAAGDFATASALATADGLSGASDAQTVAIATDGIFSTLSTGLAVGTAISFNGINTTVDNGISNSLLFVI